MAIFLVVGIALLVCGILLIIKHFINKSKPHCFVIGKVVELKKTKGSAITSDPLNTYYTPVFEYRYKGSVFRVEHNMRLSSQNKPSNLFEVGQDVEMCVYEHSPSQAVLHSKFGMNYLLFGGLFVVAIGTIFTVVGTIINNL